jgi:hypothetical protein
MAPTPPRNVRGARSPSNPTLVNVCHSIAGGLAAARRSKRRSPTRAVACVRGDVLLLRNGRVGERRLAEECCPSLSNRRCGPVYRAGAGPRDSSTGLSAARGCDLSRPASAACRDLLRRRHVHLDPAKDFPPLRGIRNFPVSRPRDQLVCGGGPWRTTPSSRSTASIRSAGTRGPSGGG